MQIICLSRGSLGIGKHLAERLADKLGCGCLGREQLLDLATDHGIPVGKLETAIVKRQPLGESLSLEADRFRAFVTATLCERALKQCLVYHGRTGHLALPSVAHVLRIRAIATPEDCIQDAITRLNLPRKRAEQYIEQVNDDIRRWVRVLYDVDWEDASHYDVTINLGHITLENSASALVHLAQLPEFHATPASRQQLENLLLAARCRLAIGKDPRTHDVKVKVNADCGKVTVTYPPRQGREAAHVPAVIDAVEGIQSFVCTVATTNIAYLEERFEPGAQALSDLIEVAEKWNAAVDLVWLSERPEDCIPLSTECVEPVDVSHRPDGGILDDQPDHHAHVEHPSGVAATLQKLIPTGRAGATHTVACVTPSAVADSLRATHYSLVVVGEVYRAKSGAVAKRLKRDLIGYLSNQLRLPVIGTEDLKEQYLFGLRQWRNLLVYSVLTVVMYWMVFTHQKAILEFLQAPGVSRRILSAAVITLSAPLIAVIVGGVAHHVLKLVKLE